MPLRGIGGEVVELVGQLAVREVDELEGAKEFAPPVLTAGGRQIAPDPRRTGTAASDRNWSLARASEYGELTLDVPEKSGGKLWLILTSEGVRADVEAPVGGDGLVLTRRYRDAAGEPVDWDAGGHALGDLVYVELTLSNTSPERIANLALVDRIPAGWEIPLSSSMRESRSWATGAARRAGHRGSASISYDFGYLLLQPQIDQGFGANPPSAGLLLDSREELCIHRYSAANLELHVRRFGGVEVGEVMVVPELSHSFEGVRL